MVPLVVLCVLDGWGFAPKSPGNAIAQANTPNINSWSITYPHTTLQASGEAVGLPRGEVGNTETGHLNLGAGRIIYQDLLRINMSIADGSFYTNKTFLEAIKHCQENDSSLHLMGLLGNSGVHANNEHLYALLKLCRDNSFDSVFIHIFTDGRDSPPTSVLNYVTQLQDVIQREKVGQIASVMGRYWAMDRDLRWDRTENAYNALTKGEGLKAQSVEEAIEKSYESKVTDEFINPTLIVKQGQPVGLISENDSVIFYNFRIDRPRQLTRAFVLDNFETEGNQSFDFDPYAIKYYKTHYPKVTSTQTFNRGEKIKNLFFITMTEYEKRFKELVSVAFPPVSVVNPLSAVISSQEKRQLKLAESEKERFVSFYFNGQQELTYDGEDKKIVDSKHVETYDLAPEMSAREITDAFLEKMGDYNELEYCFVLINFANADMVGHTGNIEATKKGCEVIDECLKKITNKVDQVGGVTIITADHGNAEEMINIDGGMNTEHSIYPVPFIVIGSEFQGKSYTVQSGILADVAPTILKLLGISVPSEMTGRPLI